MLQGRKVIFFLFDSIYFLLINNNNSEIAFVREINKVENMHCYYFCFDKTLSNFYFNYIHFQQELIPKNYMTELKC